MKLGQKFFEAGYQAYEAGRLEEAQWLYECSLSHMSRNAFAWLRYAEVLWQQKKHRNAIAAAERAIQSILARPKPNQEIIRFANEIKGFCHWGLRQIEESEAAFRRGLEIEPFWHTWNMLGRTLYYQDRDHEATDCFRQSIALDPNNEEGHYLLAYMIADEQPDEAEKHLRRAIEIDPDYAWAWTDLGQLIARHRWGTLEERRRVLEKAIELMPNDVWSRVFLAITLWQLEEIGPAGEQYEIALGLEPDEAFTNALYADFLSAERIDPERAEVFLRRAIEFDEEDMTSNSMMGEHLWRYERDDEARPFLEKAAALGHERAAKLLNELETD